MNLLSYYTQLFNCRKALYLSLFLLTTCYVSAQDLKLNDLEYFDRQGVNVLVYSNNFNGGFNDEKIPVLRLYTMVCVLFKAEL